MSTEHPPHHPTHRERLHALLDVLGYLYRIHGKPTRARDYLRLLVSLRPSESRLLRSLAHAELESGNPEAAKEYLEKSLQMPLTHRERAATLLLLSRVLLKMNKLEEVASVTHRYLAEMDILEKL